MSHLTQLFIGVLVNATVLVEALLAPGFAILNGNLFFDVSNGNTSPSIMINSGAIKTWPSTAGLAGGGVRLTNSGSKLLYAAFQVPSAYQSGAVLETAFIECGSQPVTTSGVLVIGPSQWNKNTGTVVSKSLNIATGSVVSVSSGSYIYRKVGPSQYVSFITSNSGGSAIFGGNGPGTGANDCVFRPQIREKYGR